MILLKKNWMGIIFFCSLIAIGSALVAEHVFDLEPCKMCLKQRYSYYFMIGLIVFLYFFRKRQDLWFYIPVLGSLLYGLFYSIWHVGIEQKILPGPTSCSGILNQTNSIITLKDQIINQAVINCNEITWTILSLSAATINAIFIIFIIIFHTTFLIQYIHDSEKK